MNTLQGKTALVTGAASGIGRASAMLFAAEGAAVVALDRAPEVEATVAAIRAAGGRATGLTRDSSKEEHVAHAVESAINEYGGTRCVLRECRNQRRLGAVLGGDRGALHGNSRYQL